jgi:hypothetical protein
VVIDMKDENFIWVAVAIFLAGTLAGTLTVCAVHRHYHEITKTNIGEFMLRDGKMYGVYELTRDVQGNMVTR